MEKLLGTDFAVHYGLVVHGLVHPILVTHAPYFEIEDNNGSLQIHLIRQMGMAKFTNSDQLMLEIANYDGFITQLPPQFQHGKQRCDVILTCDEGRYFILGELKDRKKNSKVRRKAREQLVDSLRTLLGVPQIGAFIGGKAVRSCCYFNKQSSSPAVLTATVAFNRLNSTFPDGFRMQNAQIGAMGFEFYEYTGDQTMMLVK